MAFWGNREWATCKRIREILKRIRAKSRHGNTSGKEGRGSAGLVSEFSSSFLKPVPRQMLLPVIGIYAIGLCLSINSSFIIIFKLKLD